jgi:hypothetical protein
MIEPPRRRGNHPARSLWFGMIQPEKSAIFRDHALEKP